MDLDIHWQAGPGKPPGPNNNGLAPASDPPADPEEPLEMPPETLPELVPDEDPFETPEYEMPEPGEGL